jgi:sensor histidine kinase YesM
LSYTRDSQGFYPTGGAHRAARERRVRFVAHATPRKTARDNLDGMTAMPAYVPSKEPHDFHPLELIPWFRRFRPGAVRNVIFTFIFNVGLGSIFWLMAISDNPGNRNWVAWEMHLVSANIVGYTIHLLFGLGSLSGLEARVKRPWAATLYYTSVSFIGVIAGFSIVAAMLRIVLPKWLLNPQWLGSKAAVSFTISAIMAAIYFSRERAARAEPALQGERLRTERIEREAALANLRALQAQIEPHFLFNTLANVTSLIDPDPATAKRMLESFIRFLRASLAATRTQETTLGRERELIAAYLEVLQVRMRERLRYRVDVPPEIESFALPPMLLQPVVENAIRHGLEPKMDGGTVTMRARREGPHVVVEVEDTGVGFSATTRGGVGLTNLRERLDALYGERARLEILDNAPCGTRVRVRLPA